MGSPLKKIRKMPGIATWLLARLVGLVCKTYRVRYVDPHGYLKTLTPFPVVVTIWHNRILFLGPCAPPELRPKLAVIISASRDGEYVADFIRHFNLQVVRGSSSRGGAKAFREMLRQLKDGVAAIVTVDGPRGPRYQPQAGAAGLAASSGLPILPVSLNAPKRWEAKSWDRLQIPRPFSRIEVVIGKPYHVPPELVDDREKARALIRDRLMEITDDQRC
jgi:lysophospholipid acyltransferase (LPLAT)-like uncharacterized protein